MTDVCQSLCVKLHSCVCRYNITVELLLLSR